MVRRLGWGGGAESTSGIEPLCHQIGISIKHEEHESGYSPLIGKFYFIRAKLCLIPLRSVICIDDNNVLLACIAKNLLAGFFHRVLHLCLKMLNVHPGRRVNKGKHQVAVAIRQVIRVRFQQQCQ